MLFPTPFLFDKIENWGFSLDVKTLKSNIKLSEIDVVVRLPSLFDKRYWLST